METLGDDGLVVPVQRDAGGVVGARSLEAAGLDLEHAVAAAAVGVAPLPDGIAGERQLDAFGEAAPVGIDSPRVVDVLHQDVRGLRRDHELHRLVGGHDPRHPGRQAGRGRIDALAAGRLVLEVLLEDELVFRRQRRLLAVAGRLRLVERGLAGDAGKPHPVPLAPEIRILRLIERQCAGECRRERRGERECADRIPEMHEEPPCDRTLLASPVTGPLTNRFKAASTTA